MAVPNLKYAIGNSASTTGSSAISNSDTSVPLTSDTNFAAESGAGMVLLDEGQAAEELAYSTGKSGSSLTVPLVNRGLEGGSAQAHASGASVKGILTAGMWNDLIDHLNTEHDDDGLHAGKIRRTVEVITIGYTMDASVGDGKAYFTVPEELDGMNLGAVHARVITAGTTGTTDIQVRNVTGTADMLSAVITIDSGDTGSDTATAAAVIDAANDDVSTNDLIAIDVDAVSTTAPKGLIVRLRFVPA